VASLGTANQRRYAARGGDAAAGRVIGPCRWLQCFRPSAAGSRLRRPCGRRSEPRTSGRSASSLSGDEDRKSRDLPSRAPRRRPVGGPHIRRTVVAVVQMQTSCHRQDLLRRPPGLGGLPEGSVRRVAGPSHPDLRWAVRAVVGLPAGSRRRPVRIRSPRDVPPHRAGLTGCSRNRWSPASLHRYPDSQRHGVTTTSAARSSIAGFLRRHRWGSSTPSSVEGQPTRRANHRRAPKCHLDILTDLSSPAVLQVGPTSTAPRAVAHALRVVLPHPHARPRRAIPLLHPRPVDERPDVRPSDHASYV